jgi:hypothetical protein
MGIQMTTKNRHSATITCRVMSRTARPPFFEVSSSSADIRTARGLVDGLLNRDADVPPLVEYE